MTLSPQTRARLRVRYVESIRARVPEMLEVRARLDAADPTAPIDARRLGHQFAGMGTSFGFPEHTERGRELEHAPPAELASALGRLIDSVRETVERESPPERE